jgi:hypothetical protein
VLVIGDSLTVGAEAYLLEELRASEPTIDARTGRPSGEGVEVLSSMIAPEHAVVVFDLGTNDDPGAPGGLAANLEAARAVAGRRCMVVSTINRPPLNGVSDAGLNAAIDRFAAHPRVQVADWRGAVAADPSLLAADGVHAVPDGYATRADLVARAVEACAITQAPPAAAEAPKPRPDPEPRPQRRPRPAAERQDGLGALWLFLLGLAAALLPG